MRGKRARTRAGISRIPASSRLTASPGPELGYRPQKSASATRDRRSWCGLPDWAARPTRPTRSLGSPRARSLAESTNRWELGPDGYCHVVPVLGILWTTLIFFAWVIFIWIAITVLIDVFRRHDISGWGKAAWVLFVVIIPWIGVLVYLIANHDGMAERKMKDAQASRAQFDDYVRRTAGGGGAAAEIEKAKQLLDIGAISQAEFDAIKAKALA